ncbi:MAG TPA: HepT-like ribonuclease domain-containing protein [Thermoanaerobaculia bacterium]|nr:HepT-like ribonuclease domain-containing protein [Thermoanaerobaculia bacterium]
MTSRDRQLLLDVLIAAEDAQSFVSGRTFEEFTSDKMRRKAVLHSLTIIGVATIGALFPERAP